VITVVVADGLPLFRDALARAVRQRAELQLVAETASGPETLRAIEAHAPDVVLAAADLPGIDGLRVARAVERDELPTRVVLVLGDVSGEAPYEALRAGAAGVLCRSAGADDVRDAVTRTAGGGIALCEAGAVAVTRELRLRDRGDRCPLSPRERAVLGQVADGRTNAAIAHRLGISPRTVRTHLEHLFDKLEAADRAHLVAIAMRRGLLE
jgi:two-component system nitrate/nitrite response regulator NarL